jgi:hypothetical protein
MRKSAMVPLRLHRKGAVVKHTGKGALEQHLPGPNAMQTLTPGNPAQRTMNDYAKQAPVGAGASGIPPTDDSPIAPSDGLD